MPMTHCQIFSLTPNVTCPTRIMHLAFPQTQKTAHSHMPPISVLNTILTFGPSQWGLEVKRHTCDNVAM